jgi:hypothetical protein
VGGAGGQRPRPPQEIPADAQGVGVAEDGAGAVERGVGLVAGGGGERLYGRDGRLVLGVFADPQIAVWRRSPTVTATIRLACCC